MNKLTMVLVVYVAVMLGIVVQAHDGIHPAYEVTGLAYGPKITNAAILNDKIVWEGKTYELPGLVQVTPGGRVKVDESYLIKIEKIDRKGVTISHVNSATIVVPLKQR